MRAGDLIRLFFLARTRRQLLWLGGVLLAVRATINLPMFPVYPNAAPAFQKDIYLTLLDLFSGGAMVHGSVLSLGLYPIWLARPLAFLHPYLQRRSWGGWEQSLFRQTWRRLSLLFSFALGWIYPAFLSQVMGAAIERRGLSVALTLTAGTALSFLFAGLLGPDEDEIGSGLKLLTTFHVLAALPRYLFIGGSTPAEWTERALATVIVAFAYGILSQARRDIPLKFAPAPTRLPEPKLYGTGPFLPLRLNLTRTGPLLWVVAAFGLLRYLSFFLAHSKASTVQSLATGLLHLTDLGTRKSWYAFVFVGLLAKWTANLSSLSGVEVDQSLRRTGAFIPGIKAWRPSVQFIDKAFSRIAWIEPVTTVGLIATVGLWADWLQPGSRWPVLLIPVLFTVLPLWDLVSSLESQLALRRYEGFMKRGRR